MQNNHCLLSPISPLILSHFRSAHSRQAKENGPERPTVPTKTLVRHDVEVENQHHPQIQTRSYLNHQLFSLPDLSDSFPSYFLATWKLFLVRLLLVGANSDTLMMRGFSLWTGPHFYSHGCTVGSLLCAEGPVVLWTCLCLRGFYWLDSSFPPT